MQNKQPGGLVAFSIVTVALFAILVGGVYAVKHYGGELADDDSSSQIASNDNDSAEAPERDQTDSDEAQPDETSGGEVNPEPVDDPESTPATSESDDYDEVVEAPDDDEFSQTPNQVGHTGPSEVAAAGPTNGLSTVLPVVALTAATIAYTRSRLAL